ncbi:lysoplasmalogenase family protein [Paracoccus xiamenensis]|uniref:lysoplasmalogenase family protein n=1 Tax=Paracoccus xiamenensis TaxID=2714901 RepID=UPI00140E0593|nr:lysoplasmalogenase [Paracoccus xiamenensis]NHF72153.1 lysoplasmalogenase [Paracoccus xiamenensis]
MIAGGLATLGAALALIYQARGAGVEHPGPAASAAKTGATAALALAGLAAGAPLAVVLGLALGALGDFFLTRRAETAFLAGMAAFAAGHLAYAGWMFTPEHAARMFWALPMLALALSTERWLLPRTGPLRAPVRAYVWVITLMAAAAATLPLPLWPAMVGAALFVASDLVLAIRLFVARGETMQRRLSLLLWPAYWGGQALILAGAIRAA